MSVSKPFFTVTSVVVLEESPCPQGPIYKSLSLDLKSLSSSHKSLNTTLYTYCNTELRLSDVLLQKTEIMKSEYFV